jgi:hypothetical protein
METFRAKLGTTFRYNLDLTEAILVQFDESRVVVYRGNVVTTVAIPSTDFLEFAAHIAGLPPWAPEKDAYDQETIDLMIRHAENCPDCGATGRCENYWLLVLERTREKKRRSTQ